MMQLHVRLPAATRILLPDISAKFFRIVAARQFLNS